MILCAAAPPASAAFKTPVAASPPIPPVPMTNATSTISLGSSPIIIPAIPSRLNLVRPINSDATSSILSTAPAVASTLSLNDWSVCSSKYFAQLSRTYC